jgi:hypothetical protein
MLSVLFIFGLWVVLGGSVYRAHKRARTVPEDQVPGGSDVEFGYQHVDVEIPDTVPSDWVEAYGAENGG